MKRYKNMISIAAITVISLGTFYTKVATSESNLPNYYLKTVKGDSKAAKQIELNVGYQDGGTGRNVKITTEGAEYRNFQSLLAELKSDRFEVESLNKLQKEEKNYMRGKISSSNFYKDNDFVWYAGIKGENQLSHKNNNGFKLTIDGLDLKTDERYTFSLALPSVEKYAYIGIQDVQLVGKELKIITSQNHPIQFGKTFTDNSEYHLYSINLSQSKIVDHKVISFKLNQNANTTTELLPANEIDPTLPKEYYLFKEVQNEQSVLSTGEQVNKEIGSTWHVINLNTGNEEKLNLSKEQTEKSKMSEFFIEGDKFYLLSGIDKGVSVLTYNLKSKKVENERTINVTKEADQQFSAFRVLNGKLYFTLIGNTIDTDKRIYIADLNNGQIIFEGKIDLKNASKNNVDALKKLDYFDYTIL